MNRFMPIFLIMCSSFLAALPGMTVDILDDNEYELDAKKIGQNTQGQDLMWKDNVLNQSTYGTCSSHAVVDLLSYVHAIKPYPEAPIIIHGGVSNNKIDFLEHSGRTMPDVMNLVKNYGVQLYEDKKTRHSFEDIIDVLHDNQKIKGLTKEEKIKFALDKYKVPIAICFYSSMTENNVNTSLLDKYAKKIDEKANFLIKIKDEDIKKVKDKSVMKVCHTVIVYGYSENFYYIKNSWGDNWRSSGKAILCYDYFEQFGFEAWLGVGSKIFPSDTLPPLAMGFKLEKESLEKENLFYKRYLKTCAYTATGIVGIAILPESIMAVIPMAICPFLGVGIEAVCFKLGFGSFFP